MSESLPPSQTHRLCHFKGAPESHRHLVVPNYVADEVEELREFVRFLFPPRGQDRFKLCRPDILEPNWTVVSTIREPLKDMLLEQLQWGRVITYIRGITPLEAVKAARLRFANETEKSLELKT